MLALLGLIGSVIQGDALQSYVRQPDSSTQWSFDSHRAGGANRISLVSQTWHGIVWRHPLTRQVPNSLEKKGIAMLCITGGPANAIDEREAKRIADRAGLPVWTLYEIPNQPLFGAKEDALIAVTFQKFFETQDSTWPLLLPMTKSVRSAMSAITAATSATSNPIKKFIVFGGSKRGWTTWLAAVGDPRVAGIAPVVFDNLNMVKQVDRQKTLMGGYSPMIKDYVDSGMLEAVKSPLGQKLAALVDPFTYRSQVTVPKYMINGANDMFWASGADQMYFGHLTGPKSILYVPDAGHTLGDRQWMIDALGSFGRRVAIGQPVPTLQWTPGIGSRSGVLSCRLSNARKARITLYSKRIDSWKSYDSRWKVIASSKDANQLTMEMPKFNGGIQAYFAVAETKGPRGPERWSTTMKVVRR